jgi:hypothetical protein
MEWNPTFRISRKTIRAPILLRIPTVIPKGTDIRAPPFMFKK